MVLSDGDMRAALVDIIGAGVVAEDDLGPLLGERGQRVGPERLSRHLQSDTSFAELATGWVHVPSLLDGVGFAALVEAGDAADGYVRMHPWFDALGWWLIEDRPDLLDPDGSVLGTVEADGCYLDGVDTDIVRGPDGWLDDLAGRWMALRVRDGAVVLERLDGPPGVGDARAEAVRRAFDRVADRFEHQPYGAERAFDVSRTFLEGLLHEAVADQPAVFVGEAVAGPDELLAAAGLRLDDAWVVPADLDPELLVGARAERTAMARYGVDADDALGIQMLLGALTMHAAGAPTAFGTTEEERELAPLLFAGLLGRSAVAQGVALECRERGLHRDALAFAREIARDTADVAEAWGATWLAGHCLLALGEVDRAVEWLQRIPASAGTLPLALDQALIEVERSDATAARRLLGRARALAGRLGDRSFARFDAETAIGQLDNEVEVWASDPPKATARRNDPCPCGSGRKYKSCHLGRELHPLEDRAAWLSAKMDRFVRIHAEDEIHALAALAADAMGRPEQARSLLDPPFLPDLVLHEQGLARTFLQGRAATLPDDEALLAQQWQLIDRSVFEVESVRGGELRLRDLATGDPVTVASVAGRSAPVGSILIGRPLPVGDVHRSFSGFVTAPPSRVDETLAMVERGDAAEIATFIGASNRPPTPTLTERAGHHLDASGVDLDTIDLDTIDLDTIDLDTIGTGPINPGRSPIRTTDPAALAAVREYIASYEKEWLDTPVPALDGQTPREAADDPTTRQDVLRLLATFAEPEGDPTLGMSAARLRAALSLQP